MLENKFNNLIVIKTLWLILLIKKHSYSFIIYHDIIFPWERLVVEVFNPFTSGKFYQVKLVE